jgi:hypothetical protein
VLRASGEILDELHAGWVAALGATRVAELERDLRAMAPAGGVRLDVAGWLSA